MSASQLSAKGLSYNYAHLALPTLALMNPKKFYQDISGSKGEQYLLTIWQGLAGRLGVRPPSAGPLLSKKVVLNDMEVFIVRLPRPTRVPDAFFVSPVFQVKKQFLSKEVVSVRYFTLELGENILDETDEYHFCEWVGNVLSGREHKNHGRTADAGEETFVAAIAEMTQT